MQPAPTTALTTRISTTSVFLPCVNTGITLQTDAVYNNNFSNTTGVTGVGFFLPPNSIAKMDTMLFKFAYTQPTIDGLETTQYARTQTPLGLAGQTFTNAKYRNARTAIQTSNSPAADWDDWYLYNRRNLKVGIFRATDISGASTASILISSALLTMSLDSVSQVNNFQNQTGTLRTREPDWGTFYSYKFDGTSREVWDVTTPDYIGGASSNYWRSTVTGGDFAPTYVAGENSYNQYFYTVSSIEAYSYLPRSYGVATSVGHQIVMSAFPNPPRPYQHDIATSFMAVPFYWDTASSAWRAGAFWGLSFTVDPCVPSTSQIGAAPYYGPPGVFAFSTDTATSTLGFYTGGFSTVQPFYWNTKIAFEVLDQEYDPATDLALFGGYGGISGELQDTMLFFYSNAAVGGDYSDLSTTTLTTANWRWGLESNINYAAWDDQSGYNFLSYIHDVPVRPTTTEYAVHVRGYDPIPQFTTGLRFIGKNYTDFGRPTLLEIANEISSLSGYTPITDTAANAYVLNDVAFSTVIGYNDAVREPAYISHEYADSLINFNTVFSTTTTFGRKLGFNGVTYTFNGYSTAINTYANFNSSITSTLTTFTAILSTATGQLNEYILDRYGAILPSSVIARNRVTDPLPFQLLFGSKTPEPYNSYPDEWGLGWNLGFAKKDTIPRVSVTSDTFIRIVQDYIYLRLNPDLNINMLAVSGKENLAETRDSAGQDAKYFSKILLANFGGYSRAAVQLPKQFNPVLGRYDTVTCQLVDKNGNQIDNTDCDYDFVLEISEIAQTAKDTATLLQGTNVNTVSLLGAPQEGAGTIR